MRCVLADRFCKVDLPDGGELESRHKIPFFDVARKLVQLGYADWHLQAFTPTGVPSLRGRVDYLARWTVKERSETGLQIETFKPFGQ